MPQRLDRNEAIALAQQGKDAWNEWAAQNPGTEVDFSSATLRDISFAGFQFHGQAHFSKATFSGKADFTEAIFSKEAQFNHATFSSVADFTKVIFSSVASFSMAAFHSVADFKMAAFSYVMFRGARFSSLTQFNNATFSQVTDFMEVTFSTITLFAEVAFSDEVYFVGSTFSHDVNFSESKFSKEVYFSGGSFSHKALFRGVSFDSYVDFSGRKFNGVASFLGTLFSLAPAFHGASIYQGTEFGNIDDNFPDFQSGWAERSYRTLKLAMAQYQARTEEAAFAALELKSRRYRFMWEAKTKPFWKRIPLWSGCLGYWLWEKFSDSGRSFLRPFALYLAFWGAFAASYVLPCKGWLGNWWAGIHYAFLKQFPFAAAFRGGTNHFANLEQVLFAAAPPPGWVTALTSLQSLIALTLIFLMGLGIRHKFRLR